MKYGLVIVNQEIGHNAYKIDRFREEFPKLGLSFDIFVNDGTLAKIEDNKIVVNLPKADFVLYLDKDNYLARELDKAGYRLFNRPDFIKMCDDKMLTNITCANLGINMPKTIAAPLIYYDLQDRHLEFLKNVEKELGYPLILKRVYGSLGEGVFKITNFEELKDKYRLFHKQPILFQEYIDTSFGKSIRALVIDGKVVGSFERKNNIDFRSNYGEDASSEVLSNPKIYEDFAQYIADKLNIEYAGIDILYGKDKKPILCEINSNAFFEVFEATTEINVAYKIGEMINRKIKEEV